MFGRIQPARCYQIVRLRASQLHSSSSYASLQMKPQEYPRNEFGDFWKQKLHTCFKRLNKSGSGFLNANDFRQIGQEMARLGGLTGPAAANIENTMMGIWEDYYRPKDGGDSVTAEQYVRQKCDMVNGALRTDIDRYGGQLFQAMDLNSDGRISRDEYHFFTKAWGIGDDARDEIFELMQRDGTISRENFVMALADYFIGEDKTSPYSRLFGDLC